MTEPFKSNTRTIFGFFILLLLLSSVPVLSQALLCSSAQSCKEIDEVWFQKLGSVIRQDRQVWDPQNQIWQDYNVLYPPPPTPGQFQSSTLDPLPHVCFPLTQESFTTNHDNFGSPRDHGDRCHAGIDLYTKRPAGTGNLFNVVAIDEGEVVNIIGSSSKGWYTCSENAWGLREDQKAAAPVHAVLIYHPNLQIGNIKGVTINYGEIDVGHLGVQIGNQISKGQLLGRAGFCGMLHLEAYQGRITQNDHWYPQDEKDAEGKNACRSQFLATKPSTLIDPTQFLQSIADNFCGAATSQLTGSQMQAPVEGRFQEAAAAQIELLDTEMDSAPSSPNVPSLAALTKMSTSQKWEDALTKNSLSGKTVITKLFANGENDDYYRKDKGRETILFMPSTTDPSRPVELVYFFHGLNGFNEDIYSRLVPQSKQMSEDGRNFVLVFPELPWSTGLNSAKRGYGRQRTIWNERDSNIITFHNQVLQTIGSEFGQAVQPTISRIIMVGHSAGGAAIKFAGARANTEEYYNGLEYIKPSIITLSDADYIWGSKSVSQTVYDNYISKNQGTHLNMVVQDPDRNSAHSPTAQAIILIKKIGGASTSNWFYTHCKPDIFSGCNSRGTKEYNTNGAQTGKIFNINSPSTGIVNYLPLNKGHIQIGTLSLAFLPPSEQISS